jgi:cyanate lyase
MDVPKNTKTMLEAKREKGLTFAELGKLIGHDEVWVAALFYGQARADEEEAQKLVSSLGLGCEFAGSLTGFPTKGLGPVVPTDPLI